MKSVLLLAVSGILLLTTIALAANQEGQISISPIIGGYTYDTNQGRESSVNQLYGVRAGYNFTRNFGIEGLFDYVHSKNIGDIDMVRYGGELLYHFLPDNVLVPYLAAGYSDVKFDGSGIDRDIHGAFDYGAGLKYFLTDRFALRLDFRHLLYNMDGRTNSNLEYTLGAYIPLTAVKPAVKPVEPPPPNQEAVPAKTDLSPQNTFTSFTAETQADTLGKTLVYGLKVVDNMIEIIANEHIKDYKIFTLTEPSRLVVDIRNAVSGFKLENFSIDKLGIAAVRFENHPGYLRIFLDASQSRILPYRVEEADKSLKIIITTP